MLIVHMTGTILANGEFVLMAGIVYKNPLNMKKIWITFFNCCKIVMGKKLTIVYFVVLTQFEGNPSTCAPLALLERRGLFSSNEITISLIKG